MQHTHRTLSLDDLAKLLADNLSVRKNTFVLEDGFVQCDLGGTFVPLKGEMVEVAKTVLLENEKSKIIAVDDFVVLKQKGLFTYVNALTRLYTAVLKRQTKLNFIKLRITGIGKIKVSVIAQSSKSKDKIIQQHIINLHQKDTPDSASTVILPRMDITSLPDNSSLIVQFECQGKYACIAGFRWIGEIAESFANFGERIVLIRTYGCKSTVISNLQGIAQKLPSSILQRTIFIVYDCSEDRKSNVKILDLVNNLKLLEMQGANFGGGGNASFLASLVLRIDNFVKNAIDEIILIDDDAKIDPEILIRHDAFITCRKDNVISTSVIYQEENPSVIQEFGGFWGKFFSFNNNRVDIDSNQSQRLLFPYLVRNSRDINKPTDRRYIAEYQEVEFSTFIFISFPYKILLQSGTPLPFFLRNDDVEICLRCLKHNATIVVNPNLYVWHQASHNLIGEIYAILHGLIVNNYYGGLNKQYFYTTFMERLAKLAKVENTLMLYAYNIVLQKFSEKSKWMASKTIYKEYKNIVKNFKDIQKNLLFQVPFEVYDVSKNKLQIENLVNPFPTDAQKNDVIFFDTKDQHYYCILKKDSVCTVEGLLCSAIGYLHTIAEHFDEISADWKKFIDSFNHRTFWDQIIQEQPLDDYAYRLSISAGDQQDNPDASRAINGTWNLFVIDSDEEAQEQDQSLPTGFTVEGYLANNPDVAQSGQNPLEHWLKFGRKENRKF